MTSDFKIRAIYGCLIAIFFLLSLIIPTTNQAIRGVFLALLLCGGLLSYYQHRRVNLHPNIIFLFIIAVSTSVFFILWGLMNGAPGALAVSTVYVIWPLLFAFFMGLTRDIKIYEILLKTIIIGAMLSAAMGIILVADALFGFGLNLKSTFQGLGASVGIYPGVISYSLFNVSTIVYAFPFIVSVFLIDKETSIFQGKWRQVCFLTLILCVIAILVSGRRALMLTSAISPFVAYAIARMAGIKTQLGSLLPKLLPIAIVLAIIFAPRLGVGLSSVAAHFMAGFSWDKDPDALIRAEQARVLLSGWLESPLLGHGLGASPGQAIRDEAHPWAYELTYLALLFQTGIVGFAIYISLVISIYHYCVRILRENSSIASYFIPTLTALTCFLIANATNPYLGKFDYLWTIFLPVGLINVLLLNTTPGRTE